ncbi:MAG: NAD-dependent epimerase/dehydratase family protein [Patescibacteria group bacterium]
MKYVVTGGAGFIGSNLVDALLEKNHRVIVIDNLSTGKKENINKKAKFYKADICDFDKIKPLFKGIDGVFHLAAIPRVLISVENPLLTSRVNIMGTLNIFKAAIENKVPRVVFASSSSIYGAQEKFPLKEEMKPNPLSPYGLQKLVGEQFAKLFSSSSPIKIISLRYFNVYGPRIDFKSDYSLVIGKFLRLKLEGKPLTIFGTGNQTRGFCFIDDVIDANIKAMDSSKLKGGEVINIGQKNSHSVNYLAELIGGPVKYLPPRPADPLHTKADTTKAKKLLNWQPKVDFKEGVSITTNWFSKLKSKKS